ncbi:hypothetical protein, partial [Mycobacterium montefiorense]|uniref:hypothetical protein n=1 Tax=Mycobacterium montefiorense TaxID=154654 RepID=UPI0035583FCD
MRLRCKPHPGIRPASQRDGVGGRLFGEAGGGGVAGPVDGVGIAVGSMVAEVSSALATAAGAVEAVSGPDTSGAAAVAAAAAAAVA